MAAEEEIQPPVNRVCRRRLMAGLMGAVVLGLAIYLGALAWPTIGRIRGPHVIWAGSGPDALAISPDGQTLYVADYGDPDVYATPVTGAGDTVTPVDLRTGRPGRPIKVGNLPEWLALVPARRTLYVLLGAPWSGAEVVPVDLASGVAGPPMRFPGGVSSMLVSRDQRTLYVADCPGSGMKCQVVPVDMATGRRGRLPITLPNGMGELALSPDGTTLCGVIQGNRIVFVNMRNGHVGPAVRVDDDPWDLAFSPDGKWLYVAAGIVYGPDYPPGQQELYVVSTASGKVVKSVALNAVANAIAVAPDGRTVYIQNEDTSITPVNTVTWDRGGTILAIGLLHSRNAHLGAGAGESSLVISPDGRTLYASNGAGVAVIPLAG
jgi:DNA-binding beta-propeller fold protein YncE